MSKYTTQVGMDVHARSVSCKALRPDTGECWSKTFGGEGYEHELLEWLKALPGPVRCSYESGCTGFWMSRFLERGGIACEVMAVSTIPRSPKNKKHKDDTERIDPVAGSFNGLALALLRRNNPTLSDRLEDENWTM